MKEEKGQKKEQCLEPFIIVLWATKWGKSSKIGGCPELARFYYGDFSEMKPKKPIRKDNILIFDGSNSDREKQRPIMRPLLFNVVCKLIEKGDVSIISAFEVLFTRELVLPFLKRITRGCGRSKLDQDADSVVVEEGKVNKKYFCIDDERYSGISIISKKTLRENYDPGLKSLRMIYKSLENDIQVADNKEDRHFIQWLQKGVEYYTRPYRQEQITSIDAAGGDPADKLKGLPDEDREIFEKMLIYAEEINGSKETKYGVTQTDHFKRPENSFRSVATRDSKIKVEAGEYELGKVGHRYWIKKKGKGRNRCYWVLKQ